MGQASRAGYLRRGHKMRLLLFFLASILSAAVIRVGTTCDGACNFSNTQLQAAVNSAKGGDILELSSGESFSVGGAPVLLKQHTGQPVIIRSSKWHLLKPNRRVGLSDTPNLAKVCTPATTNQGVFKTDHVTVPVAYWTLKALWITVCGPNQNNAGDLVILGDSDVERRPDQQSHHFILDQVLISGHSDYDVGPKRGMGVNAHNVEIKNSLVTNIKGTMKDGSESHGIGGWQSLGDVSITNTAIDSGTENFLWGGARAKWPGHTMFRFEITGSLIQKRLNWNFLNRPHAPFGTSFPPCAGRTQAIFQLTAASGSNSPGLYVCADTWRPFNWQAGRQPACLSDETGGVHWRDTSKWPSPIYDCINGKWELSSNPDQMHSLIHTATDVIEGPITKIYDNTKGISNLDHDTGTWVMVSGVTGSCSDINRPHQIQTFYNYIEIKFDSAGCGQIDPKTVRMEFQFSNWDSKNGGEFKNSYGAEIRGNVFRNCLFPTWQSQKCRGFLMNLTNEQDGPGSTLRDITFVNNKFAHAAGGVTAGAILCDGNNKFIASKIIRGNPTQLLDSYCHWLPGDQIFLSGAPAGSPWEAINGWQNVIALGDPGFGGDAFIDLDSTNFPAPTFDLTPYMNLEAQGVNRRPGNIVIENNIFNIGHPITWTGGYIGGAQQFSMSVSASPPAWYSADIGSMAFTLFDTTFRHNTVAKPEHGAQYDIYNSLFLFEFPFQSDDTLETLKPRITNIDNIWEGNTIIGYRSETPCTKAMEVYSVLPMFARNNIALKPVGSIPTSGYDKHGCEGFSWETSRDAIGYTDYYAGNLRLTAESKYHGKASDGSNPGASQNLVDWETETAISGEYNPYLTMQIKTVDPTASAVNIEYIGYDTSPCEVAVSAGVRRFSGASSATHTRIGRRGSVTVSGLEPRTNYWLRLTCAGKYRDRNFSTS